MKSILKKIFWISTILSLGLIYPIWSQNNSELLPADSLDTITVIDSGNVEIDSTFTQEIIEEEPADTFYIDIQKLKEQVNSQISKRKEIEKYEALPYFIYNENFHLKSLFEPDIQLRKNGYLILPFLTSKLHLLQNYSPLFRSDFSQNQFSFYQNDFNLPVAITNAILGLGDPDMNHASVCFQKGDIFNIRKLNVKLDYFGQDGYWYSIYEKSSNFNMHLFYEHQLGKFHYYHTSIDQEIPSDKLLQHSTTSDVILEKSYDNALLWENKIVNAGIQLENYKVDKTKRKQTHLLLNKTLFFPQHNVQAAFEYFIQSKPKEKNLSIFSLKNSSEILSINIGNTFIYQDDDNFLISSEFNRKIFKIFNLIGKYSKIKYDIFSEKKGLGLELTPNHQKYNIIVGEMRNAEVKSIFLETNNNLIFKSNQFQAQLFNWTFYLAENDSYPKWQTKTFLNLIYNLEYSNAMKLGFSYFYNSDFQDVSNTGIKESSNLDAYFAIKITNRFEIKVDAINILNSEEMFGAEIPQRHYNFGVNWIFVN